MFIKSNNISDPTLVPLEQERIRGRVIGRVDRVEVAANVGGLCKAWADLVRDSQMYVGQSWQSCESGHACLNDGWHVGGRESLRAVGSHCGPWSRQS